MKACDYYYLGDYRQASNCIPEGNDLPYVIAALVFRGEHELARRLFKSKNSQLSPNQMLFTNFHLGLSYTRTSEYDKAKELFFNNWQRRHEKSLKSPERFLIYQGLSFFRFFFSRHKSSLVFAQKAREEIEREKSSPILFKALVYDLIAHNYFQLGKSAKGEVHLEKAYQMAKSNSFSQLEEEFEASLAIYRSHFSMDLSKSIKALKKLLKKTSETNDYTCSEVVLQISKLYLLGGHYKEANDFLIKNFNTIYKNDNRRKVAKLNTLLAQLMIPRGQYMEALSLLKVAKSNLNKDIDLNLLTPILGVEGQVLDLLNQGHEEQESELQALLRKTDKGILHQIHDRNIENKPHFNKEDSLGVIFDRVHQGDIKVLEEIIQWGLFHLVRKFFKELRKTSALIVHPQNHGVFLIDEVGVTYESSKLSQHQLKLLTLLSARSCSKEDLIKEVWGYLDYDPLRHDHLIYSLIRRTRKVLGRCASWLQSSGEDSYYLSSQVQFIKSSKNFKGKSNLQTDSSIRENERFLELNFRQVQVLEGIFDRPFSTGDMVEYFGTTRMTSYRDLDELVAKGLITKRGDKRGARYWYS